MIIEPELIAVDLALLMLCLFMSAARNHVNRMCLAADVPLVESGTAGYLGQVTVVKKVGFTRAIINNNHLYVRDDGSDYF